MPLSVSVWRTFNLLTSGRGLSTLPNTWLKNILLLVVNPFPSASAVIPLCRAFLTFKAAYFEGVDKPSLIPASNVALQIVPVGLVTRKEGVVMRGLEFPAFLRRLYDRCEVMENTTVTNTYPIVCFISTITDSGAWKRVFDVSSNFIIHSTPRFPRVYRLLPLSTSQPTQRQFESTCCLFHLARYALAHGGMDRRLGSSLAERVVLSKSSYSHRRRRNGPQSILPIIRNCRCRSLASNNRDCKASENKLESHHRPSWRDV